MEKAILTTAWNRSTNEFGFMVKIQLTPPKRKYAYLPDFFKEKKDARAVVDEFNKK